MVEDLNGFSADLDADGGVDPGNSQRPDICVIIHQDLKFKAIPLMQQLNRNKIRFLHG